MRIEVGYGLEGDLTDAVSKLIIENAILPAFRRGDFASGIRAGVHEHVGLVDQGELLARSPLGAGERVERALEVRHRDALVHGQALDLVEHRGVGGVQLVGAEGLARRADVDRDAALVRVVGRGAELAERREELARREPSRLSRADLVEDLERESAEFGEWWPRYDVAGEAEGDAAVAAARRSARR